MGRAVFLKIENLLTGLEVARLAAISREIRFVDGRASNPANTTKDNLQADYADPKYAESVQIVSAALARSRESVDFAMPRHVAPPLLSRYEPGMRYGGHADSALIQVGNSSIRSDLSCTVFISDPRSYEGGELSIEIGSVAIPFKGSPGEAIVYPSTTLHEVMPVRSGQRLVSITFIESHIADEHRRTQVYELNEIAALEGLSMKWESRVRLDVVRQNLIRMWSTP
jgi:PKHD-type hydroxylase